MGREDYIVTIGLEVHAQLTTQSKMFCGCRVQYGEEPNTLTCPVCLGLPGAMPVLNEGAIRKTILTGLMLGCEINPISKWDRKNYFYPDMPKNYQLSQFDLPLCVGGGVPLYDHCYPKDMQKDIPNAGKVVKLTRIHLEEDVAKSTHLANSTTIDFNRAGTPLMEIVSDPDIDTAEEAFAYLNSLRQILLAGGVSDADMEKGQMRCDVNVSIRRHGETELGAKIELKNLNSVSAVRRSLHYEVARQVEEIDQGIAQVQSTRRWDDDRGETTVMRTKEDAHDYRYFPEPDLLPVRTAAMLEEIRPLVPELPHEKAARYVAEMGVSGYDASVLSSDLALAAYFEAAVDGAAKPKLVANWVINDLPAALNAAFVEIGDSPVPPAGLRELVDLVGEGKINGKQAKEVFAEMFDSGKPAGEIVKEKGMEQVSDTGALGEFCDQVIAENEAIADQVRGGAEKAVNALVGRVMKLTKGQANPKVVMEVLLEKLKSS